MNTKIDQINTTSLKVDAVIFNRIKISKFQHKKKKTPKLTPNRMSGMACARRRI